MHIGIQLDISFYFYNIRLLLCLLFSCAFLHELISFAFFVSFFFFLVANPNTEDEFPTHTRTHSSRTHTAIGQLTKEIEQH